MEFEMQLSLAIFLAVWLFSLGACIGSFMNVVIFRLPAGMRLWKPNSRCPQCLHAIRWFDNLPILSWMNLGGRCRDCGVAISSRYPFVELLMGAVFLCVGVFEGLSMGGNLPTVLATPETTWLVCAAHWLLLSVLISAAFMQFDGHRPPAKLYLFAILSGFVVVWIEPGMIPYRESGFQGSGLAALLAGLLAGGLIGIAVTFAGGAFRGGITAILPWALTGQFLGWQSICWLTILVTLVVALRTAVRGSLAKAPTLGVLAAVTIAWLVQWGSLSVLWPQWTANADASLLAIAVMFAAMIALMESRQYADDPVRFGVWSAR